MELNFKERIKSFNEDILTTSQIKTIQVNLGNLCNQKCIHCHVEAGPDGTNIMDKEIVIKIINFLKKKLT